MRTELGDILQRKESCLELKDKAIYTESPSAVTGIPTPQQSDLLFTSLCRVDKYL